MSEINLLPEEERKQVAVKKLRRKLTVYSVVALVITAAIAITVFSFWAMLVRQEKQLAENILGLEKQISSLSNVETLARVLKNKLSAILTISAKVTNFEKILLNVAQVTPAGVTLSDLTVSEQHQITLGGSAISASEFSNLISALLRSEAGQANFSNVSVESVTRDDKGIHKFTISAKLKDVEETQTKTR